MSGVGDEVGVEPLDEGAEKARTAIGILRAANLSPGFGFDQDTAEQLWGAKLRGYDLVAIMAAANEWVSSPGNEFPTLAEFLIVIRAEQIRLDNPPADPRAPRTGCPECGDSAETPTFGWVEHAPLGQPSTVRPCSLCRPEQYVMWQAGHYRWLETARRCHCNQPGCRHARRRAS